MSPALSSTGPIDRQYRQKRPTHLLGHYVVPIPSLLLLVRVLHLLLHLLPHATVFGVGKTGDLSVLVLLSLLLLLLSLLLLLLMLLQLLLMLHERRIEVLRQHGIV